MSNEHMKTCSTSYVIMEMQIETTMRYHYVLMRIVKIQNTDNTKHWRGCGAKGTPIHCWWGCKMVQPLWKPVWWFLTKLNILIKRFSIYTPWYLLKGVKNLHPHKTCTWIFIFIILYLWFIFITNFITHNFINFFHNCQNLEATKMSFSRWMDKLWYIKTMEY